MSRSQSLTPVGGQWDTWERGWSNVTIHKLFFPISIILHTPLCWGSRGILTCSGWEGVAWNHQGLMSEWRSSPQEQLQSLDLSPPQRHLRTTVSLLAGWPGLLDKSRCSWSCGTETWRLWLWHPSLKCHLPACQEKYVFCYGKSFFQVFFLLFSISCYWYIPSCSPFMYKQYAATYTCFFQYISARKYNHHSGFFKYILAEMQLLVFPWCNINQSITY